jgi:hypothetical protein
MNIVLAGTCRVNIRWSRPVPLSGDAVPVQGKWGRASGRGNQREVSGATKPTRFTRRNIF